MSKPVYAISICGRMVLDMHSLNNEGGEGNQTQTRMVTIVHRTGSGYRPVTVNAISGDMFKHIQAEHFYRLAKGKLPLCGGCERFSASRILDDPGFMGALAGRDSVVVDALLNRCALDDIAGNLIAKGNRSVPRKSVAEFGWVVGLPDVTRTESYFHVRYAADRGEDSEEDQPIFHRPASSGVYAVVANFETSRVGFNDITQTYALKIEDRERRYRILLESVLNTFIEPNGAMRGTQNPHILGFQGVISVSSGLAPAPLLSPLEDGYEKELERIRTALNKVNGNAIELHPFTSSGEFAEKMQKIISETEPFSWGGK